MRRDLLFSSSAVNALASCRWVISFPSSANEQQSCTAIFELTREVLPAAHVVEGDRLSGLIQRSAHREWLWAGELGR